MEVILENLNEEQKIIKNENELNGDKKMILH